MSEPPFLRVTWSAVGVSRTGGPGARPANTSLEEERREVLDSVLGATIERRGLVSNGIVNFAGTSFAGMLALAIALGIGF